MDERLEKALEQANYIATIQNQKKNIQLRFSNNSLYSVNGGTFMVDQQLIAFAKAMIHHDNIIVIDQRGNPILIEDPSKFYDEIVSKYIEATQEFYTSYSQLRKARNTKAAVGI